MTHAELLQSGLSLMLSGIGFVMFFLLILIYAIQWMSNIINRFFPEPVSAPFPSHTANLPSNNIDHLRPAIVAAVVHHHRQQQLK